MLAAALKDYDRLVLEDPILVISHRFPLADIHQALEIMASPKRNKVVIHP